MLLTEFRCGGMCPAQGYGRAVMSDGTGVQVYLRHRHGRGSISIGPTLDDAIDTMWNPNAPRFGDLVFTGRRLLSWVDDECDGFLRPGSLPDILNLAGFDIGPEVAAGFAQEVDSLALPAGNGEQTHG